MENIIIFGAGGHAKVVIDLVEKSEQYRIIGLLDGHKPAGTIFYNYEILGNESYIAANVNNIEGGIVAIGDNVLRAKVVSSIRTIHPQFRFITAIHPHATLARGVVIGGGTVIMAGAIINSDTNIGEHCIVNTKASIDHDSAIGDFVTLAPNATTGGNVTIGSYSTVSLGANIIHSIVIGEHIVIGAGSTVLSNIESHSVAYGTPARFVRKREAGDRYL